MKNAWRSSNWQLIGKNAFLVKDLACHHSFFIWKTGDFGCGRGKIDCSWRSSAEPCGVKWKIRRIWLRFKGRRSRNWDRSSLLFHLYMESQRRTFLINIHLPQLPTTSNTSQIVFMFQRRTEALYMRSIGAFRSHNTLLRSCYVHCCSKFYRNTPHPPVCNSSL